MYLQYTKKSNRNKFNVFCNFKKYASAPNNFRHKSDFPVRVVW